MTKGIQISMLLCFLFLVSCGSGSDITDPTLGIGGGGGSGGSSSGGDNPNVTGRWSGTWFSSVFGRGGSFSITLNQNGSSFTGSGSISGSDCFFGTSVSGSMSGNRISFGFASSSSNRVYFSGSASSSSMSGTYEVSSGFCAGDEGTFSAT